MASRKDEKEQRRAERLARESQEAEQARKRRLYSIVVGAILGAAAIAAVAATVVRADLPEPIGITRSADGLTVVVKIAVSESRPAADTCRDVYTAVVEQLERTPGAGEVAGVRVEVSRIG